MAAPWEARHPDPRISTPKHLAERILTSRDALEGERKQVTVLFADLKGSMELLASRDPEEARKLIERDPDVGGSAHPASVTASPVIRSANKVDPGSPRGPGVA